MNFNQNYFAISREIREGIIRCILATDMARHNEILSQFQEISPHFDYTNQSHVNLVCSIVCVDETLPLNVFLFSTALYDFD